MLSRFFMLLITVSWAVSSYAQAAIPKRKQTNQTTQNRKPLSSSYTVSDSMDMETFDPRYSIIHYWNSARKSLLEQVNNIIEPIQEQYRTLSPKVKFTTGTMVGFASTKVVLGAAFKMIKFAAAAYLVSELLNYMGLLEDSPFPDEGKQLLWKARKGLINTIHMGREAIQNQINVENFQTCMEKDHMTTIGFVAGTVACLIL